MFFKTNLVRNCCKKIQRNVDNMNNMNSIVRVREGFSKTIYLLLNFLYNYSHSFKEVPNLKNMTYHWLVFNIHYSTTEGWSREKIKDVVMDDKWFGVNTQQAQAAMCSLSDSHNSTDEEFLESIPWTKQIKAQINLFWVKMYYFLQLILGFRYLSDISEIDNQIKVVSQGTSTPLPGYPTNSLTSKSVLIFRKMFIFYRNENDDIPYGTFPCLRSAFVFIRYIIIQVGCFLNLIFKL